MALYIGLDLGTFCGFSVMCCAPDKGTALISGTWDCSIKAGHDSPSLRVLKFRTHLRDYLALSPDILFYELVRAHKGVQAAHVYGAFLEAMQEECDAAGVPYQGIGVSEIKKHITGKGNAGKPAVIKAVQDKFDIIVGDDNEADAIAITDCGRELISCT